MRIPTHIGLYTVTCDTTWMSRMQSLSTLQIEQLKLAKETSEVLLRDCPKYLQENVRSFYEKQIIHLLDIVDHTQNCKYDTNESSCECGYVTAKSIVQKYQFLI